MRNIRRTARRLGIAALAAAIAAIVTAADHAGQRIPFSVGERFTYDVRSSRIGRGRGVMWVDGPTETRGTPTVALHFDIEGHVGPLRAFDRSVSWLDTGRFAVLRSWKAQRQVWATHDERVEIYPEAHRWSSAAGASGSLETDAPLDELSFIYFLRSVPLSNDSVYHFERHFDAGRNPTTVVVLGRQTVETPIGQFRTIAIEMRVKDSRNYKGEGRIRINLSDDACRIPVQMRSTMPLAGTTTLTLASRSGESSPDCQ